YFVEFCLSICMYTLL
ncbi:hypothetical protein, partial [Bacillus thuringiensis]